jgi:hypothetical protein
MKTSITYRPTVPALPAGITVKPFFQPFTAELAGNGELVQIQAVEAELKGIDKRLESYNASSALRDIGDARSAAHQNPTPENLAKLDSMGSLPELQRRYGELARALDAKRTELCQTKLLPQCMAVLRRVVVIATRERDRIQAREQELAAALGISFKPSESLLYLSTRIAGAEFHLKHPFFGNPNAGTILDFAFRFDGPEVAPTPAPKPVPAVTPRATPAAPPPAPAEPDNGPEDEAAELVDATGNCLGTLA